VKYFVLAATTAAILVTTGSSMAQDWTGAYAGAHAGGQWGKAEVRDDSEGVDPGPFGYSVSGGLGGATFGYNFQAGDILTGLESNFGYLASSGSGIIGSQGGSHQDLTLDGGVYGDLTGRVGFVLGQTLVYGKGGAAFFTGRAMQATTKPEYSPTGTSTFVGWTVGGGVEQMIAENISIKAEYQHYGFGEQRGYQTSLEVDDVTPKGFEFDNYTKLGFDTVKVGINFHF
jgi:outer membrane immunogenic protein